jgi:putative ABC transport system ATP-binding protein
MIEVKNITKVFGKKDSTFKALDNVSVSIPKATTVAITGKSGSGKSTLMHIMSGLDHASAGTVTVNGKVLSEMSHKQVDEFRAKEMSFIFQAFFVEANQTCLHNVMLPLEIAGVRTSVRAKRAREALESVELLDKADEKARNLSGGQKQRLAIARATVNKPKLIFADEPTGNLDSKTGDLITNMLFDLNKKLGAILIIVTHDEELANKCAMRIVLKDGRVEKILVPKKRQRTGTGGRK